MPWPMIHFCIAYRFWDQTPTPAFLLGSIAPDATLNDKERRQLLHLGKTPTNRDLIAFVRMNAKCNQLDKEHIDFLFGYISHIFADVKWVNVKNEASCNNRLLKDHLWMEENQMDFNLFRSVVWKNQLIEDILKARLCDVPGFFTIIELDYWRRDIFKYLDQPDNEPKIQNTYITQERVEKFIEEIVEDLKELQKQLDDYP